MQVFDWPDSGKRANLPGQGFVSGRHQGGTNCVFADGHAKWIKTGADLCRPERGDPSVP
jgi:prepilin-type processing-associated H-X9-DG protein